MLRETYLKSLWRSLTFTQKKQLFTIYYELLAAAENGGREVIFEELDINYAQIIILRYVIGIHGSFSGGHSLLFTLD